jgi:hypothetical protein
MAFRRRTTEWMAVLRPQQWQEVDWWSALTSVRGVGNNKKMKYVNQARFFNCQFESPLPPSAVPEGGSTGRW